ncbi:MAG: ABC transporter permease [Anaerolineae bacterium]|nr:ABC transporter permease [Anaerolineae bacterium]
MTENSTQVPVKASRIDMNKLDRMVRRFERIFTFLVPIIAVLSALILMAFLILSVGSDPWVAYQGLFSGMFGNNYDTANTLNRAAPLMLMGLGVAVAYRGGLFNIGGEGQIAMGGLFASIVGIYVTGIPSIVHIPLCILAGFIGGAVWSILPGYFFAKHGINLIITTVMMNEIANSLIPAIVKGPMLEPPGYEPQSYKVLESARLPLIWEGTRLHAGILIAILAAVIFYIVLFRTPFGFAVRCVGENETAAKHSGLKVFRIRMILMMISGGLGGIAGSVEILGAQYRLREAFLANYGYEALAVALLGQKHPLGVIISGVLFGGLKAGGASMQRATNLPMALVAVVSGVIILFVIASGILMRLPRYLAKKEASRGA